MTITKIKEHDKKRLDIYIDYEHAFFLYKSEVRKMGLKEGEEISEDVYREIVIDILQKRATLRAMNLLQKRDYTVYKLREKLKDGGYPLECVDNAIRYVESYGYLDDNRYARDYITYNMSSKSMLKIKTDLLAKGIDKDIIDSQMQSVYESENTSPEREQIKKLLIKKHYDEDMTFEEKQKIKSYLYRKGYSIDLINSVINESFL